MSSSEIAHHPWSDVPLETLTPHISRKVITGDGMMIA